MEVINFWQKILVSSGFNAQVENTECAIQIVESTSNREFLLDILAVLGFEAQLLVNRFTPEKLIEPRVWYRAVNRVAGNTEGGRFDDLDIMEAYIAGIVVWINHLGLTTTLSCEGHQGGNHCIEFRNQADVRTLNNLVTEVTNGEVFFRTNSPKLGSFYWRANGKALDKESLPELAKQFHVHLKNNKTIDYE